MATDEVRVVGCPDSAIAEAADASSRPQPPDRPIAHQLIASVILPGVSALHRRVVLAVILLIVGGIVPLALLAWVYFHRDNLIGFSLDQGLLTAVIVVVTAVVLTRVIAVAEVAHTYRRTPDIRARTAIAGTVVLALAVPSAWVAYQADQARQVVGEVFSSGSDDPLFQPDTAEPFQPEPLEADLEDVAQITDIDETRQSEDDSDIDAIEGVLADDEDLTAGDSADPAPVAVADADASESPTVNPALDATADPDAVHTTLLLGGDAAPGRWGMRTDTMMLFTVHEASGRTALVSIPRNLTRLHFPPETPLQTIFPNGFDDLANAVFTYVSTHSELVEAYGVNGQRPEVVALAQGLGYSLDVRIDDFVLVNMRGFLDIVDAVGGVRIEVSKRVLLQEGNPVRNYDLPESIGPGDIDMDGTLALAYVRARRGDSDYSRMGRQRQVLAALGSQVSTKDAVAAFPSVSRVLGDAMRTSLSAQQFSDLLDQFDDSESVGESVGLTPPLITPSRPDYANLQSIIDAVEQYVRTGEPSGFAS